MVRYFIDLTVSCFGRRKKSAALGGAFFDEAKILPGQDSTKAIFSTIAIIRCAYSCAYGRGNLSTTFLDDSFHLFVTIT